MHHVYGNAFLTIIASAASDSDEGLVLYRYPSLRSSIYNPPMHREPISGRAWALQEWVLSPRRLVFSKHGIIFICNKSNDESLPWIQNRAITATSSAAETLSANITRWQRLVSNYCSRDLTMPRDKFTAFSGVAQSYAKLHGLSGEDYLAGLWRCWLPKDLLWKRRPRSHSSLYTARITGRRPGRAPTWSWASLDGNVEFISANLCPGLEVKNCQVELAVSDDFFGQVKSGVLELSCLYATAFFRGVWVVHRFVGFVVEWDDSFYLTEDGTTPGLFYLQVGFEDFETPSDMVWGTVVRFDEEEQAYVRLGCFYCCTLDFRVFGRKTFKIV